MAETNPFPSSDADRHAIWDIVVQRDTDFFLSGDWSLVADDYIADGFLGINAGGQSDPALVRVERLARHRQSHGEG